MIFFRFMLQRLSLFIPILLGLSFLSFSLGVLSPSDPALVLLTMDGQSEPSEAEVNAMRDKLGLNAPFFIQFLRWLWRLVQGDFGQSYVTGDSVLKQLLEVFPVTLEVSVVALSFVFLLALPLGTYTALQAGTFKDTFFRVGSMMLSAIPGFWLSLVCIRYFAEEWQLLPTSGYGRWEQLILPAFVLAIGSLALMMRLQRSSILEQMGKAFVFAEKSQGLSKMRILLVHVLPNAALPVITYLGSYTLAILGGSVVVESIFSLPGLGSLVLAAIRGRDYPVIQGYVVFMGILVVLVNLAIDISYFALNPKLRSGDRYEA